MVKIEVTTDTPREMADFLKEMGIDKIVGAHKCRCHHAEEPLKIPDPGSSEEPLKIPEPGSSMEAEPQAEPEHKEEIAEPKKRVIHRGGNPEMVEEFDRLCKEKGLTLKPEGKNTSKKICSQCGNPFYGYQTSRVCPACKSLRVRKPVKTSPLQFNRPPVDTQLTVKASEPVQKKSSALVAPPPKAFTQCIKCNTPFKAPQPDPMCPKCRKTQDRINEQLRREREEQEALERERRLQEDLESRTKWKVCPACGATFIPENGNFYCKRCTERALKVKKLKK